jgi:hypothetical protein
MKIVDFFEVFDRTGTGGSLILPLILNVFP